MLPTAVTFFRRAGGHLRSVTVLLLFSLAACGAKRVLGQHQTAAFPNSSTAFSAAGIGTGTRLISGFWQFHLGDDPTWAQPDFDDRGWERLPADQPWGDAGHPGYAGFAWYRRQIALDPADKQPLALLLPPLDSVAEVYWNGVKIGSVGTLPPDADWPSNPGPVAVSLPSVPGARSGQLAIRIWEHTLGSTDPPDAGGFQAAPQLGFRPVIQRMPQQSVEHLFRTRAVGHACYLLLFFVGIAALVLWTRSRSQWVLFAVGVYLFFYALTMLVSRIPIGYREAMTAYEATISFNQIAGLFVILLLADLPRRAGIAGARFWWGACILISGVVLLANGVTVWAVQIMASPSTHLFHVLDISTEILSYVYTLFVPVLLVACFFLSKLTLPRLLFLVSVGIDVALGLFSFMVVQTFTRLEWFDALLQRPVLHLYGSNLNISTLVRVLVLLSIVYAVSDQIRRQVARQRFVDAEMKAAQEIQQVLVPAAVERQAPGFEVSSVYRPASEVGGDFFQIIPLSARGTPIVSKPGDEPSDGGTLIVAGDVSGKGLGAAMTVSLVVGTLRTLAEYDASPAAVLAGLNRRLLGRTQGGFVTCCVVRMDASGHAIMANAGHCHPYLDGREVDLPDGLPLGIVEDAEYEEIAVHVLQGQQLTLLSDGVVEARNPHGELYGFERLQALMQRRPSAEHVASTAVGFGQEDDITVLTLTRLSEA